MKAQRTLALAGLWGALLTIVILAMTVLLRLGTHVEAGEAVSTLPQGVEPWARLAHRVAAMAVGILAALALIAAWRGRPIAPARARAVAAVVALTLGLAVIGRFSAGYRFDLVTVGNVAGGIALVAAFWWVRTAAPPGARGDGIAAAALALLIVLAGFGAAAVAAAMRGEHAFGPLHLWLAGIFLGLTLATAWRGRARRAAAVALGTLSLVQFGLGFALLAPGLPRPMVFAWVHAMIACVLALLLAGFAARRS